MSEQSKNLVRRYITEMWQEGNEKVVHDLFGPAFRYREDRVLPAVRTSGMNEQSSLDEIGINRSVFGNRQVEVHEMVAEDQQVIGHWLVSGAHSGPVRFHVRRRAVRSDEDRVMAEHKGGNKCTNATSGY